jgi:hypothetical protein
MLSRKALGLVIAGGLSFFLLQVGLDILGKPEYTASSNYDDEYGGASGIIWVSGMVLGLTIGLLARFRKP